MMRRWLCAEMELWVNRGILSLDQKRNIEELYETQSETAQRKNTVAIFSIMGIAAAFVGLGVLLLIGYNWQVMPSPLKLAIIFGLLLGVYGVAFRLRANPARKTFSEIAFLFGNIFYGVAIWQIAQIFNIQSHYPNGLWVWAMAILPFALCLDTILLHVLLAAVLAIWVGTEIIGYHHLGVWFFGWRHYLHNGAYTLPLFAALGLIWAYRKRSPATVGLYALLACWWIILLCVAWDCPLNPIYFVGTVGGLMLFAAECHPTGSELAAPYRKLGILLVVGTLIPLGFVDFHRELLYHYSREWAIVVGLLIVVAGVLAAVAAELLKRRYSQNEASFPFQVMLRRHWMPLSMMLFVAGTCLWHSMYELPAPCYYNYNYAPWLDRSFTITLIPALTANALILVFSIWMIRVGLREENGRIFAGGVILTLAVAVMRYIDLFEKAGGMIGAALMFFLCGTVLFGVARFWQTRKSQRNEKSVETVDPLS